MGTLAESVISGAQDTVNQQQHTMGDAIQAYHVAQTAAHATQELEMEKQNQQINKSNFVLSGLNKANSLTGPMQKQYITQFADQWKRMDPNADTAGLESLVKSPDDLQNYLGAMKTMYEHGGVSNVDQANYIAQSGTLEGAQKAMDDHYKFQAEILAGQARAQGMGDRTTSQQELGAQQQWNSQVLGNGQTSNMARLNGAARILNLLNSADRGDFKTNKAFLGQMNMEISRLETGSAALAEGSQEKTEMKDTAATLQDILDTGTGKVTGVDLSAKIKQARGMIGDLSHSYMDQIEQSAQSVKAGALPSQQPILEAKHEQLKQFNRQRFGYWPTDQQQPQQEAGAAQPTPQPGPATAGQVIKQAVAPSAPPQPQQSPNAHLGRDEMIKKVMENRAAAQKAKQAGTN